MAGVKLESVLQYLEKLLGVSDFPDYSTALNGIQVEGPETVRHLAAAGDASEETIGAAVEIGADLLLVHHGLFWDGLRPLTGRRFRRVAKLIAGGVGLYSVHLPLDAHPTLGNAALLARALGLEPEGPFGEVRGAAVGWWAGAGGISVRELEERLGAALQGPVRLIEGGGERVERVAIVTGAGGSFIEEAAGAGFDALITGEGSHHTYVDAVELGIHVLYGGHYATETFGVKAISEHLSEKFGLTWDFLDFPSGL